MPFLGALLYTACGLISLRLVARLRSFTRSASLVLLLLPLLLTGRALLGGGVYAPIDIAYAFEPFASISDRAGVRSVMNPGLTDQITEFVPWHDAVRRSIARGEWPLWNPYEMAGTPLAGAAQAAPYHPITIAGLLLPASQYFGFAAAMLYLMAALGAFVLARDLEADEPGALFAGAAWMASSHLLLFVGTALGNGFSLLPFVILGARRIVRQPGAASAALLTTSLVLVVLSGHPETTLHVVVLGVVWCAAEFAVVRPPSWGGILAAGVGSGITALLLTAFFLLPHLEVIAQSQEYVARVQGERRRSSSPEMMRHLLMANFFPFVEGAAGVEARHHTPETEHGATPTAYIGSLAIALAVGGFLRSQRREKWFLAVMAVVGLAAGITAPGVTHVLTRLPGFEIAVNERMIGFTALALALLAALGIGEIGARRFFAVLFIATAFVVTIAASLAPDDLSYDYVRLGALRAALPLLLSCAAILLLSRAQAASVLFVLLLVQRAGESAGSHPTVPARAFFPQFPGLQAMQSSEPFRIVGVNQMMPPALSTHYGLEDVRGFQAVTLARFEATYPFWCVRQPVWFNRVDDLSSPILSLMNVRFALVAHDAAVPAWWQRRVATPRYDVVENMRVLPRAFVPRRVHHENFAEDSLAFTAKNADFGADTAIESGDGSRGIEANGPGTVRVEGRGSRLRLHAKMEGAGWIVVSNAAWRGWRGRLADGSRVPIRVANHAFLAFRLPAGTHVVDMVYRPRSFVTGGMISAATFLIIVVIISLKDVAVSRRSTEPVFET